MVSTIFYDKYLVLLLYFTTASNTLCVLTSPDFQKSQVNKCDGQF